MVARSPFYINVMTQTVCKSPKETLGLKHLRLGTEAMTVKAGIADCCYESVRVNQ